MESVKHIDRKGELGIIAELAERSGTAGLRLVMAHYHIRFDEIEDVLASIDLLPLVTPFLRKEPWLWKWTIIAAHGALQGAMVCVLAGTSGIGVLTATSAKKWMNWHDGGSKGPPPKEHMADFVTLLSRCTEKGLKLSAQQSKDIARLHKEFRNNFAHFKPKSWSIEKVGLPRIVNAALDGVEVLMKRDEVEYRMTGNRKRRLAKGLKLARETLK